MTMWRAFFAIFFMMTYVVSANAVTARSAVARTANPTSQNTPQIAAYNYNYMYPYLNNQMRTDLNPGVTPSQGSNPIDVVTRTEQLSAPRRVVSRTSARSATSTSNARAATATTRTTGASSSASSARRVVPRAARTGTTMRSTRSDGNQITNSDRIDSSATVRAATNATPTTGTSISSTRCLADYTECMNSYCQRADTAYNRCYCSAKLAQIDATYQPAIDNLIKQILRLQSSNAWSDAEMNEYWMSTMGKYTGDNSWVNLDNALNINWAGMESRVRGQQTFATGHDYCVQHLRDCASMATNMRDAYRSEIARDCATYESGLAKIKNAAESIVEMYSE